MVVTFLADIDTLGIASRHIEDGLRNQAVVYDDIGHIPQVEIPERSANDMHQWLSKGIKEKDSALKIPSLLIAGVIVAALLIFIGVYYFRRKK